jgi:hypothetical protein
MGATTGRVLRVLLAAMMMKVAVAQVIPTRVPRKGNRPPCATCDPLELQGLGMGGALCSTQLAWFVINRRFDVYTRGTG